MKLRSRSIALALILLFGIQTLPISVFAQPTVPGASLAIVGLRSGKSTKEEKTRKLLSDALIANQIKVLPDPLVMTKLQEFSSLSVDPKSETTLKEAYEHFNAGQQFYWKLDLTNALKEFNLAVRGYREGISGLRDNYYLLFSHLYLGITLHFLGRVDEGKKFIQEMVMLDPERKTRVLPQRDFPPKIVELHRQILQEIISKPLTTLSVDSIPSGAQVILDGSEAGRTPIQIKDVPPGQHFLSLDLPGYQQYGSPIQINPGLQNFITSLREKNIFRVYAIENQTDTAKIDLKTIANSIPADILLLGQTNIKDGNTMDVQTQIFDARDSSFSEIYTETLGAKKTKFQSMPVQIKNGIRAVSSEPSSKTTLGRVTETPATDKTLTNSQKEKISEFDKGEPERASGLSKPFYKKWWFWGVIGAVAVGAGASVLLLGGGNPSSNTLTIDNPLLP